MMLELRDVSAGYGSLRVLHSVGLKIHTGEVVALLGPNGAGKTTLLKTVSGLIAKSAGSITLEGQEIAGLAPHNVTRRGVSLVSEGMNLFVQMSVYENLQLGSLANADPSRFERNLAKVFELFPRLKDRRAQQAGTMSGGERRMLAIGRALMAEPRLLLIDEPSLGLDPRLSAIVYSAIGALPELGHTVLLVEQNVSAALGAASRAYVLEQGEIVLGGSSAELSRSPRIQQAYLGTDL